MSVFNKPASQVTAADLVDLLQESAVEGIRLEFKSDIPDKAETVKKLSSFANTFGGLMVIGAKANSSDGRLQDLPGVDEQPGYKQKIVQWCFDGTTPPLVVEVSDPIAARGRNGKVCYVIRVAESDVAPHFMNGRKGVWVRSDEFSQRYEPQLATENEIRHLLDRRRLVIERRADLLRRSRRRFETALIRRTPEGEEASRDPTLPPRLEVCFGPRFPARPLCEQGTLVKAMQDTRISWRQTSFPYASSQCLSQHESVIIITPEDARNRMGMLEANIWGLLFYGAELEVEIGPRQTGGLHTVSITGIHLYRVIGYLLVFAEHAKRMMLQFGYEGPLMVYVALDGILGIPWLYSQDGMGLYRGPSSELDEGFSFSLPATTDSLSKARDGLVRSLLQPILFGMNWADYASDAAQMDQLLRNGYHYNFWGNGSSLQL